MGEKYADRVKLGGDYSPSADPFPMPSDVKVFGGYGADESDIRQGFIRPTMRDNPEFDKQNYVSRWTIPKEPDIDPGDTTGTDMDWEFRQKDLRSKGFMTRPRIPTERS